MALKLNKICKSFNTKKVINNFSYVFCDSGRYHLLGANGIGKTTLLKIIAGFIAPDSGTVCLDEKRVKEDKVAYIDNNLRSFFLRLSCMDNLIYFGGLSGLKENETTKIVSDFSKWFDISFLDIDVNQISQGQLQLLNILRGFLKQPRVLLFDECFLSLDGKARDTLKSYILEYQRLNKAISIYCSHDEKTLKEFANEEISL